MHPQLIAKKAYSLWKIKQVICLLFVFLKMALVLALRLMMTKEEYCKNECCVNQQSCNPGWLWKSTNDDVGIREKFIARKIPQHNRTEVNQGPLWPQ